MRRGESGPWLIYVIKATLAVLGGSQREHPHFKNGCKMQDKHTRNSASARERLLDAAYQLFSQRGVGQVGVEAIVDQSGCAKSSLYNNFESKQALAIAFLDQRAEKWTHGWLEAEVMRRADTPEGRLLAIFDVFDGWFRQPDFEGCSFINVLLETPPGDAVRDACAAHLANIRKIIHRLAVQAGLKEPARFAHAWHMMMKGSIVTAGEGHPAAARTAQRAARMVLDNWPRKA